ncbi:hypothetical protein [Lonomia obliqua multiple nucleopolyhedrovirus]|uniref:Uncharacterized protein n=1 Tax=Lonomia obliqua multiple nucleopolyhedrovirus TaxID=134394 RepID=A0A126FCB7_9ABAC|nr:hypothetical protein [Lonomia obliqua multiple nucleopolyhedrovirus]AKN80995.1 hypothetical protein [Lonomia obliqua multiple nucleopolyhedrovirus]
MEQMQNVHVKLCGANKFLKINRIVINPNTISYWFKNEAPNPENFGINCIEITGLKGNYTCTGKVFGDNVLKNVNETSVNGKINLLLTNDMFVSCVLLNLFNASKNVSFKLNVYI